MQKYPWLVIAIFILFATAALAHTVTMNLVYNMENTKDNLIRANGSSMNATASLAVTSTGPNNALYFSGWTTSQNAQTMDTTYAIAYITPGQKSESLVITGFNFSIPSGSTINGIQFDIMKKKKPHSGSMSPEPGICDSSIYAVKNYAAAGINHSTLTCDFESGGWPLDDTYESYGNSADTWGLEWTAEDVNGAGFGISIQAKDVSNIHMDAYINHVRATVYYTQDMTYNSMENKFISSQKNNKVFAVIFAGSKLNEVRFNPSFASTKYKISMKQDDESNRFILAFANGTFNDIEKKAQSGESFGILPKLAGNLFFSTPGQVTYFLKMEYRNLNILNRTRFEGATRLLIKNLGKTGQVSNISITAI